MNEVIDMSTPVTRGELREELGQLEQRFDGKLERLEHRFDQKLEVWGGALLARIEQSEKRAEKRFADVDQRFLDVEKRIVESERRLSGELAQHAQAICEAVAAQISVIDEKYRDLPGRVSRLEVDAQMRKQR